MRTFLCCECLRKFKKPITFMRMVTGTQIYVCYGCFVRKEYAWFFSKTWLAKNYKAF